MHVAIIGLGLIGGSIGLALKQANEPGRDIVGYARRHKTASTALRLGAIDRAETNLTDVVREAEIVIIATPVLTIKEILSQIGGIQAGRRGMGSQFFFDAMERSFRLTREDFLLQQQIGNSIADVRDCF